MKNQNRTMTDRTPEIRSLAALLADLKSNIQGKIVTVGDLLEALHERGIAMLLLIFAVPMALPIPVPPGINVVLATPLILLTAQQALGSHKIWLPAKMKRRTLDGDKLKQTINSAIPWMERLELLIRPRIGWLTQDSPSRLFGGLGVLMALTVCIPVPLTNTVPSFGIALMAIGFIMRDGLAVLAGAVIGMAWITMLAGAVLVFGPEAFEIVRETIKSLVT